MKQLFSKSRSKAIVDVFKRTNIDELIKKFMRRPDFFRNHLITLYPKLNFLATRYYFDSCELLESLLAQLYNESKEGEFLDQVKRFSEAYNISQIDLSLIGTALIQYMDRHNSSDAVRDGVDRMLSRLTILQLLNNILVSPADLFGLKIFCIQRQNQVAFYSKSAIRVKLNKTLKNYSATWEDNRGFKYFRDHAKNTLFLMDAGTNSQIEAIYSKYYSMVLTQHAPFNNT